MTKNRVRPTPRRDGQAINEDAAATRFLLYTSVRLVLRILQRLLLRVQVEGVDRFPMSGRVIVVCNHLHNVDPFLLGAVAPRPISFMCKKEPFRHPIVRWLFRGLLCFPVDRGNHDLGAIRQAERTVISQLPLGLFPEGTRSVTGSLMSAHRGAGFIAMRTGAVVVPVAITGTESLPGNGRKSRRRGAPDRSGWRRPTVRVRFGEPFTIPPGIATADDATDYLMRHLAQLLPPAYRGVYDEQRGEAAVTATVAAPT